MSHIFVSSVMLFLSLARKEKPQLQLPVLVVQLFILLQGVGIGTRINRGRLRMLENSSLPGETVVIVGAARTPIGSYGGALSSVSATELGAVAIRGAIEKAGISSSDVDACYMGNVYSANLGQAPARQAAMSAGLPESCVCTTVNKVCSSGLKSVTFAAQEIAMGQADIVVAGGMENMSMVPYYLPKARFGMRMGHGEVVDGLIHDGLFDPYLQQHMGMCAESCAKKHSITREDQDKHALSSYKKSKHAWGLDKFKDEVVPVRARVGRNEVVVERDEECFRTPAERIKGMRPAFQKDDSGTVTSGNASGLNDGAAALVLTSVSKAMELGLSMLGSVIGYADAEQTPEEFTTAPSKSIPKALSRTKIGIEDVDVFEINEAFSVVEIANRKLLNLQEDRVNIYGGAVSLGHPLGCSGARILVTLLTVMKEKSARYGVAGICNGGGGSTAIVIEKEARQMSSL